MTNLLPLCCSAAVGLSLPVWDRKELPDLVHKPLHFVPKAILSHQSIWPWDDPIRLSLNILLVLKIRYLRYVWKLTCYSVGFHSFLFDKYIWWLWGQVLLLTFSPGDAVKQPWGSVTSSSSSSGLSHRHRTRDDPVLLLLFPTLTRVSCMSYNTLGWLTLPLQVHSLSVS